MRALILASAFALVALPALAQTSIAGSGSNADSGSNSTAVVAPSGNIGSSYSGSNAGSSAYSGSQANGGTGSAGAGVNFNYSTSTTQNIPANTTSNITENGTLRGNTQAPDVVISGANACGLPLGASTSILGFGFAAGATPTDKGCERRDDAAAAHALGLNDVAVGIMCESPDFANAMAGTGHACPPVAQAQQRPVAAAQPLPTGDANANMNNEVAATAPAPAMSDYALEHRAWCKTLNPADPKELPYIEYDCRGISN
jgi:hypothetical protein